MTTTTELRDHALAVADVLDPAAMTGEQAVQAVRDLAVAQNALGGALLFTALRVARTDAWQGQGFASAPDWLAGVCGISVREAAGHLGTARKAENLDRTKDAMKKGQVSPDQAGAVAGAADVDPAAEEELLASARKDTNKDLKDKAAKKRAAATDSAERERRIRRNRYLRRRTDADGALHLHLYGPAAGAAGLEALLKPYEDLIFRHHRSNGIRDTHENRAFDAFFAMLAAHGLHPAGPPAPSAAAPPDAPDPSGPTSPAPRPGDEAPAERADPSRTAEAARNDPEPADQAEDRSAGPEPGSTSGPTPPSSPVWRPPWDPDQAVPLPARLPAGNNTKVIVVVDHTALRRGHTTTGETCEIAGIGPVSVETVRQILQDDPFLAVVIRKGQDIVNVAHHGRGLNAAQRTAIEAGGIRCSNVACNQTIALQVDHRHPYAADPVTELTNNEFLCPRCHARKTNHGHALEPGTGRRRFLPPDHPDHPGPTNGREAGSGAARPGTGSHPPLPDPAPTDRPLSDHELEQLDARIRTRLAQRGRRVEQPTLC